MNYMDNYNKIDNIDNVLLNKFRRMENNNITSLLGNELFELLEGDINENLNNNLQNDLNIELNDV